MTAFLIVLVIILFGVAIWQMSKIFQLSQSKSTNSSEIANDDDNNVNGWLMMGFTIFTYVLLVICFWKWWDVLLPEAASEHGAKIDSLMYITMCLIFVVGFFTLWLLGSFSLKYRGKEGTRATFFADNDKLEFIWTIIPVIVLAGLIIYGLFTWTDIMNVNDEDDPMIVEHVTAEKIIRLEKPMFV